MACQSSALHPIERSAETDGRGDRRRPSLEASRRRPEGRLLQRDLLDHLAAGHEWRHRLEQLAAAPQHADAGRPVGLVAGKGIEIDAELAHVDGPVGAR